MTRQMMLMAEESAAVGACSAGTQRRVRCLQHALFVCLFPLLLAGVAGGRDLAAQETAPRGMALPVDGGRSLAADEGVLDVGSLLNYFETIVFEAEYRLPQGMPVVAKWQGPLRIGLSGTVSRLNRRTVERHVRTLAELTGLDMQVLPPMGEGGNVSIYFLPRKEMDHLTIVNVDPGRNSLHVSRGIAMRQRRPANSTHA